MSNPLSWSELLRVLGGLALVLLIFFVALRVLRRVQPGLARADAPLRVVTSLALSPRERLLLIQVGEQQLLLGSGPQGLRCLHVLPQTLEVRKTDSSLVFSDWLRKSVTRGVPQDRSP
ncbi:flagellar biosynthetic protein FliO [Thiomonas sp. FB-Cd]|uniref:flagellar biosynthetic protein FliO n=1 Tax=Thiomonas sp. FB-Cd TaxID=1158292 RepID=UPI0009DD8344|nr:flagellar biosynthetic protein FliO [Thiomonas sp. FB-Cd]